MITEIRIKQLTSVNFRETDKEHVKMIKCQFFTIFALCYAE